MTIPDSATLFVARNRKYFEAEGLRIATEIVQGGGVALPKLKSGALDFSIMNYVAAIQSEVSEPGEIKLVTDAYQAVPEAFMLMVPGASPIRSVADLRGKRILVLTLNSVSTLSLESRLRVHGLTKKDVLIAEKPVQDMIDALNSGTYDAAWMTEPFISAYAKAGGRKLDDMMQAETNALPIAGWATSGDYAERQPETVRAFQRAMLRAQTDVGRDRSLVTAVLPTYTRIDPATAATITIGTFPLNLALSRVQRVSDLMQTYDYIPAPGPNIQDMLLPQPALPATTSAATLPPPPSAAPTQQGPTP